jgi:hypothetical protein
MKGLKELIVAGPATKVCRYGSTVEDRCPLLISAISFPGILLITIKHILL